MREWDDVDIYDFNDDDDHEYWADEIDNDQIRRKYYERIYLLW